MSNAFDRMLRWRYNIDELKYVRILDLQEGHCAVCPSIDRLQIDHDHTCCSGPRSCGVCIRGILCDTHNTTLAINRDDADQLDKLADYLRSGGFELKVRITNKPSRLRVAYIKPPLKYPRITPEQAQGIRASTGTVREIAERFTVSVGTVSAIRSGKAHNDIV